MFDSALEIYKLIFMFELLVAESMFAYRLQRRSKFPLRLSVAIAVCFACAFLYPAELFNAMYSSVMFLVLFVITIFGLKFCFREGWYEILFCAIAAYTVQHIAYEVFNFFGIASGVSDLFTSGIYGDGPVGKINGYVIIMYGGIYGTVYWLMYLFFGERILPHETQALKSSSLLGLAALIVLVDIVLNMIATYRSYDSPDIVYSSVIFLYNVLSCVMALVTQFGLLSRRNLERELIKVYELRDLEHKQYSMSQSSIDLINRKCHDIKHQIRTLGKRQYLSEDAVKELENEISIYDTSVKTGNAALDTILTEKRLYCKFNDIQLTCMADGSKLKFIKDDLIYALFGNILDNAIEAVMKLDKERRVIGLAIQQKNDILSISCYNYYDSDIRFKDGLPLTSKGDTDYHGYGMRSIKSIADNYGGNLSVVAKDNVFTVNLLFPVNRNESEKAVTSEVKNGKKVFTVSRRKFMLVAVPFVSIALYVSIGLLIVSNYYVSIGAL